MAIYSKEPTFRRAKGVPGIVVDIGGPEICTITECREWAESTLPLISVTPEDVIAASTRRIDTPDGRDPSGIYFLCAGAKIIYIGRASAVLRRLRQHRVSGVRFDAAACISGVPHEALPSIESCFLVAWPSVTNRRLEHPAMPGSIALIRNLKMSYKPEFF